MNLADILKHRQVCLIHNEEMAPFSFNSRLALDIFEDGLMAIELEKKPPYKKAQFKHDGTFTKDKGMTKHFRAPFLVVMACAKCRYSPITPEKDGRSLGSLGMSMLMDIRKIQHYYSFDLYADANGTYDGNLGKETIKYSKDDKFYHLDVDLKTKQANFKMGTCAGHDMLETLLEGLLDLKVPNVDTSKFTSIEQVIEKFKLYNLFS